MHVLHLLSNKRWTERAEPAAGLALAQRALGQETTFACGRWPWNRAWANSAQWQARERGLDPLVLGMDKHFRFSSASSDVPVLRRFIAERGVQVLHAHMDNAHLMAALAAGRQGSRPLIVRNSYQPAGPSAGFRSHILHRIYTDGLIVICPEAARLAMRRFKLPPARVEVIEPGIDLEMFDPAQPCSAGRATFGLGSQDFVVGMVTRIREDRRVDLPIDAVQLLASEMPSLRLLLVGRGESEDKVKRHIARLGLGDRVILGGYCREERLVGAYRAMDALVYPAPGTDQSCRTVREAMATGVPVVAARTGFLPRLVEDGVTGRFTELTAADLARVMAELHADRDALAGMRSASLATARQRFPTRLQAERTMAFYERLAARRSELP